MYVIGQGSSYLDLFVFLENFTPITNLLIREPAPIPSFMMIRRPSGPVVLSGISTLMTRPSIWRAHNESPNTDIEANAVSSESSSGMSTGGKSVVRRCKPKGISWRTRRNLIFVLASLITAWTLTFAALSHDITLRKFRDRGISEDLSTQLECMLALIGFQWTVLVGYHFGLIRPQRTYNSCGEEFMLCLLLAVSLLHVVRSVMYLVF